MEHTSVKTNLSRSPAALFNGGVRSINASTTYSPSSDVDASARLWERENATPRLRSSPRRWSVPSRRHKGFAGEDRPHSGGPSRRSSRAPLHDRVAVRFGRDGAHPGLDHD